MVELDRKYFIKSVISLLILALIFFLYLNVNIRKSKLNQELSTNTENYIELREKISKLEIEYNKLTANKVLEKKAVEDFDMKMPDASDVIRVKDE